MTIAGGRLLAVAGKRSSLVTDEPYLNSAEAIAYLRTTRRTLYRRLAQGEIPAVRLGHQWRFRKSDLDAWIAGQSSVRAHMEPAIAAEAPRRSPRVLVVDDEPEARKRSCGH